MPSAGAGGWTTATRSSPTGGAVLLLLGCLGFMCFWLWQAGMPAWITVVFLFLAFILFLGITRIISEGGLPYLVTPMVASDVVIGGIGTRALGLTGIAALSLTYMWASDIITFVMVSCSNGLKIIEEHVKKGRRLIFPSMVVALVVSMGGSAWVMLSIAYEHGGLNTSHYFLEQTQYPWQDALVRVRSSVGAQVGSTGATWPSAAASWAGSCCCASSSSGGPCTLSASRSAW